MSGPSPAGKSRKKPGFLANTWPQFLATSCVHRYSNRRRGRAGVFAWPDRRRKSGSPRYSLRSSPFLPTVVHAHLGKKRVAMMTPVPGTTSGNAFAGHTNAFSKRTRFTTWRSPIEGGALPEHQEGQNDEQETSSVEWAHRFSGGRDCIRLLLSRHGSLRRSGSAIIDRGGSR